MSNVSKAYEIAKEVYAGIGVDTDKALEKLKSIKISLNCWQGDDLNGFCFRNNRKTAVFRQPVIIREKPGTAPNCGRMWKRPCQ